MIRCHNCGVYSLVTLLIVSSWITTGIAQRVLDRRDNEDCKPRPTLVALNAPSFNMFPFYVKLLRCGGSPVSNVSPRIKACVADETQEVKVKARNFDTGKIDNIFLKNHTSCKEQCKDTKGMCDPEFEHWEDNLCYCKCNYENNPPEACPARFKWNKYLCQCECDEVPQVRKCLKEKKQWSNDQCGCVCSERVVKRCKRKKKDLDEKNCECVEKVTSEAQTGMEDKHCISMVLLFSIMIVEFLLVIFLFDLLCLCRKGFGFVHFLRNSVCNFRNNVKHGGPPLSPNSPTTHDTTTYL